MDNQAFRTCQEAAVGEIRRKVRPSAEGGTTAMRRDCIEHQDSSREEETVQAKSGKEGTMMCRWSCILSERALETSCPCYFLYACD